MTPDCAMVMAAGLGRRMLPLTANRPKPLVEVAGRPLLAHALAVLQPAGVRRIVVNVHYLADCMEAYLRTLAPAFEVRISDERGALLETGGGIVQALPLIDCDPFFAINTDCVWGAGAAGAAQSLAAGWDEARMDALLLLVPTASAHGYAGTGDFSMDAAARLTREPARPAPWVYTGLQLLSKRLFAGAPAGAFSLRQLWDRAARAGRLYGQVHAGAWHDVGTAQAVAALEAQVG